MTQVLHSIYDFITPIYSQKSKDVVSRLPYKMFKQVLNLNLSQQFILNELYMTFDYSIKDKEIKMIDKIRLTGQDIDTNCVIQYHTDNNMYAQLHSHEELKELLILNESNKFFFLPISLSYTKEDSGHACVLIFDQIKRSVIFFDPNGYTTYQNNSILDEILNVYIELFNIDFSENYKYIRQIEWLKTRFNLNGVDISNNLINPSNPIEAGHCKILTVLIPHLLNISDKNINEILSELNKLNQNEKIDLIMGYTERTFDNLKLLYPTDMHKIIKSVEYCTNK
jgi:hypothetical protein